MISPKEALEIGRALHTTWGTKGAARRAVYEAQRRFGLTRRSEQRWLQELATVDVRFRDVELVTIPERPPLEPQPIRLYGALEIDPQFPDAWHVHPFTGFRRPLAHWSALSEGDAATGDIKDLWELGRFTWLGPLLQRVAGDDDAAAEEAWQHIESFIEHNPPYRGPQWMCGQESALRGIVVMFTACALRSHPASTPHRLAMAARLVATTVGRVRPTIGYALSQRNNHAISEAAFLWTAAHLVEGMPRAPATQRQAARALAEAIADQFYEDGAYAQHSPTYQRVALHALLWVAAVASATSNAPPLGVLEAIERSARFLLSIVDRRTGQMPNLGGNDGALLFALTPTPIRDFRAAVGHAAARTGVAAPTDGPAWAMEAAWFGIGAPVSDRTEPLPANPEATIVTHGLSRPVSHHVLRGESSHAVLRAGPIRHRPAHADQLHVDMWIDGVNVASDAGSYRYTAPWENALADEMVHNLPRIPGRPQAIRRGRFLWTRWVTASVLMQRMSDDREFARAQFAIGGVSVTRTLARRYDSYLVIDESADLGTVVRWNLPAGTQIESEGGVTLAEGTRWRARFLHAGSAIELSPDEAVPTSGWSSLTYGARERVAAIELRVTGAGVATAEFSGERATLSTVMSADECELFEWLD